MIGTLLFAGALLLLAASGAVPLLMWRKLAAYVAAELDRAGE